MTYIKRKLQIINQSFALTTLSPALRSCWTPGRPFWLICCRTIGTIPCDSRIWSKTGGADKNSKPGRELVGCIMALRDVVSRASLETRGLGWTLVKRKSISSCVNVHSYFWKYPYKMSIRTKLLQVQSRGRCLSLLLRVHGLQSVRPASPDTIEQDDVHHSSFVFMACSL